MSLWTLNILLIEDSLFDAEIWVEQMANIPGLEFQLQQEALLSEGLKRLASEHFDVVLLDLTLPDGLGFETLKVVQQCRPEIPIVILTGLADLSLAKKAVREGAQDYLFKDEVDGRLLVRALTYAIERKKVQLEDLRLKEAALEMSRKKSEFLAFITHELRNPLSGIVGYAHLLSRTDLSPLQDEYVNTILNSGRSLSQLLNNLLELSSTESGRLTIERKPLDLRACLEEALAQVLPQARERRLEVVLNLDPALPISVLGDTIKLRQVVLNLLLNSLKFTEFGYLGLSTRVKSQHQNQAVIRFVVEDSGRGIPPEKRAFIFQPFKQAKSEDRTQGAGLGLAISHQTVESMGGVMGVESRVGRGTAFWFDLPFEVLQHSPKDQPLLDRKVLILEPHKPSALALTYLLEQLGAEVERVSEAKKDSIGVNADKYHISIVSEAIGTCPLLGSKHLITSYTNRGKGPQGEIYLPRPIRQQDLLAALQEPETVVPEQKPEGESSPQPERVALIIDDEEVCRRYLDAVFTDLGYCCYSAADGAQALRILEQEPATLVITDWNLPDMSGADLTATIHQNSLLPGGALILAATGAPEQRFVELGLVDAMLTKPVEIEILEQTYQDLRRPLVDFNTIDRLRGYEARSKSGFVDDMLASYRDSVGERSEDLSLALESTDHEKLRSLAHMLRGSAGMVGALSVERLARELENRESPADCPWLVRRLKKELELSAEILLHHMNPAPKEAAS